MINLYALTYGELANWMKELGEKPYRARQIWRWIYESRVNCFDAMTDLPGDLIKRLEADARLGELALAGERVSVDGTRKRVYRLADGQLVETVLMRYDDGRLTACLSTQAGCAMGCVFCATGDMGFARHLSATEIFEQAMLIGRELAAEGGRLSNIVLMGMGEPFHNYDASLMAIRRFMRDLVIGARHITVSTVGMAPQIRRFADEGLQVTLAVSLHRADDKSRSALMPVNRRWDIADVLEACQYYIGKTGRRVSFEWAAIAGENDSIDEAHRLGQLLRGMLCHVNIIPLNPIGGYAGLPSHDSAIDDFRRALSQYGVSSSVRVRRGIDIEAGCGQLKTALLQQAEIRSA